MNLFKGDFYPISWGKMNACGIILRFRFLKCHILVLEEGFLFQNVTHCMQFILEHNSFLDRKPFHCQLHMGRKTGFPGCSLHFVTPDRSIGNQKRVHRESSLCWVVSWTFKFPNYSRVQSTIRQNTSKTPFSWGLYLAGQPGVLVWTWLHAKKQN